MLIDGADDGSLSGVVLGLHIWPLNWHYNGHNLEGYVYWLAG